MAFQERELKARFSFTFIFDVSSLGKPFFRGRQVQRKLRIMYVHFARLDLRMKKAVDLNARDILGILANANQEKLFLLSVLNACEALSVCSVK